MARKRVHSTYVRAKSRNIAAILQNSILWPGHLTCLILNICHSLKLKLPFVEVCRTPHFFSSCWKSTRDIPFCLNESIAWERGKIVGGCSPWQAEWKHVKKVDSRKYFFVINFHPITSKALMPYFDSAKSLARCSPLKLNERREESCWRT